MKEDHALDQFKICEVDYEIVFPVWREKLWPHRQDPIRPLSSMTLDGSFDMSIYEKYQPVFFGLYKDDLLVGVNSCHLNSAQHLRSRGLYVDPVYRGHGLGGMLLRAVIDKAKDLNADLVWSYPKNEARNVYRRQGFEVIPHPKATETHSYVVKKIEG